MISKTRERKSPKLEMLKENKLLEILRTESKSSLNKRKPKTRLRDPLLPLRRLSKMPKKPLPRERRNN